MYAQSIVKAIFENKPWIYKDAFQDKVLEVYRWTLSPLDVQDKMCEQIVHFSEVISKLQTKVVKEEIDKRH